jgi:putative ABC transport system permease protein
VTVGGVTRSIWLLFGSVSLLLLIACSNVAALLLSRGAEREREIAVRFALGASRRSVVAELMTEVAVLAVSGSALGLLVAGSASSILRVAAPELPRVEEIRVDLRLVMYTLVSAGVVTVVCGLIPAVRTTRRGLASALTQASRSYVSRHHSPQMLLVGVQIALAVTLLTGAGLLLRTFQELGRVAPGFDPNHVLTFHISTTWAETADRTANQQRVDRILERLSSLPGVETATISIGLPGIPAQFQVEVDTSEGRTKTEGKMFAQARQVAPEYFAALRIPVVVGEVCRDDPANPTMMVNRSFAETYFHGESLVGRRLVQPGNTYLRPSQISGIAGDARETGLDRMPVPTVYWCSSATQPGAFFVVRTAREPTSLGAAIRRAVHELEPQRSVYDIVPLADRIADGYSDVRLRTIILSGFAVTALALACVGLYGTLSYAVNIRRREIGLRLALGAHRSRIVRQYLSQALIVSTAGCLIGLLLATALARALSGLLFGVSQRDPSTLLFVVLLMLVVSQTASLVPALRAARLSPMKMLREE